MMNGRVGFLVVLLLAFAGGAEGQLCVAPAAPVIIFAPTTPVAVGQTYGIDWSDTAGDGGSYVVERSATARFDDATFTARARW